MQSSRNEKGTVRFVLYGGTDLVSKWLMHYREKMLAMRTREQR